MLYFASSWCNIFGQLSGFPVNATFGCKLSKIKIWSLHYILFELKLNFGFDRFCYTCQNIKSYTVPVKVTFRPLVKCHNDCQEFQTIMTWSQRSLVTTNKTTKRDVLVAFLVHRNNLPTLSSNTTLSRLFPGRALNEHTPSVTHIHPFMSPLNEKCGGGGGGSKGAQWRHNDIVATAPTHLHRRRRRRRWHVFTKRHTRKLMHWRTRAWTFQRRISSGVLIKKWRRVILNAVLNSRKQIYITVYWKWETAWPNLT